VNSGENSCEHPKKGKYGSNMNDVCPGQLRLIRDAEYDDDMYLVLRKKKLGRIASLVAHEWEILHQGEVKVWFEHEVLSDIIVSETV
jgi:hypothetical protein